MNSISFKKNLLSVQEELLRFAYKLTADREEANDLLQETSLKALDNEDKYIPDTKLAIIGEIWKSRAKLLRNRIFEKIASVTG